MAFIGESGNRGIHNAILVSLAEPQKDSRRIAAQKKSLIRNKRKRLPTSSYFDDNICDGDRFYPAGSGKRRRSRIQKANHPEGKSDGQLSEGCRLERCLRCS